MKSAFRFSYLSAIVFPLSLSLLLLASCGGGGTVSATSSTTSTTTTTTTTTNAYATAYQSAKFNNGTSGNMTVSFPSSCSMTVTGTGVPYQHQSYYLVPVSAGGTVVATTGSGIQLMVSPYSGGLSSAKTVNATFNTCPTKATSTTNAGMGAIGLIFSGTSLFNPYEATSAVAMSDNASYTFSVSGVSYTASFLDSCAQHTTGGGGGGSTWHYHANPTCWTTNVDGATGASHIIGIALDGFPIYGGRDVSGNVIDPATLDSCNGITSATPEFPSGAYHYVLPIDAAGNPVTTNKSSLNCFSGTVNATLSAQMKQLGCKTPLLLANGNMRLPDGSEVSRREADIWMQKTMPGMQIADMMFPATDAKGVVKTKPQRAIKQMAHSMMDMSGM